MEAVAPGEPRHRDLVVIGASAGGVETLKQVVSGLPANLRAAICIVLHIAPESPSALAGILRRAGRLPCQPASDGDSLTQGQILVAPPDRHLVVEDGRVRVTVGPRENNHRPSVDVLFRTAAVERGANVIGIILSGTRDDGTAGLAVIKSRGGAAIVQDPKDALYPGMPESALHHVSVDAVVPSSLIAKTIAAMVNGDDLPPGTDPREPAADKTDEQNAATLICPECGGVLSERTEAGMTQWECRVGHRYSPETLVDAQGEDVEAALWAAVRALQDRSILLHRLADRARAKGQIRSTQSFRSRAHSANQQADLVRSALTAAAADALRTTTEGEGEGEDDPPDHRKDTAA